MNRFWNIAVALAVTAVTAFTLFSVKTPSMGELSKSVVQIEDFCSGTAVVDPNTKDGIQDYVLTAKHCLGGKKVGSSFIVYTDKDGKHYGEKFIVYAIDEESDLALLQRVSTKDTWGVAPLEVYRGKVEFGDKVQNIGYPMGLALSGSEGYLGEIIKLPYFLDVSPDGMFQYVTMLVSPGSSGSSLFKDGKICGTLTGGAIVIMMGYQSFWVPQNRIVEFMEEQSA